jgi:protein ImuB
MTVVKPDGQQSGAAFSSEQSGTPPKRQLVIWCPDWPVVAAATQLGLSLQLPLAVFERGEVFACSTMARVEGVRRGMRRRDASGTDRSGAERSE